MALGAEEPRVRLNSFMRLRIYDPRILAIDLRPRRFGYALFEGPRMLLDWGICEYLLSGNERAEIAGRRLAALLKICSPSTVVLKTERWESAIASPSGRALIEAITRETSARSIPICLIRQNQLRRTFLNLQCETKEEIAHVATVSSQDALIGSPLGRECLQYEASQ